MTTSQNDFSEKSEQKSQLEGKLKAIMGVVGATSVNDALQAAQKSFQKAKTLD